MNDDIERGPTALIWLHLLNAGEFQQASEIHYALREHHFANFYTTLKALRDTGAVATRKVQGKWARYGVTPTCRVPQGVKVAEVLEAAAINTSAG